ncbi:MAG: SLAP domain-containing protein [Oscillospiraceae bacterium]|nr:SLAP domain-containing protein [Oscillospiraceae bacterium]
MKTSQQPDTEAKPIQESPQNYFLNKNNFAPDLNNVSVKPGYVRYENGKLVADCFVINGLNAIVHDITVESLSFCDANDRVIASASFGELQGVALGPNQYIVWTFSFGPETIENFSADLSILSWDCKTSYYH